ncbi:MAG: PA2169 family four-helix-bundle protein [Gemmataceae bacterium]|nr:PA2169 family four-helix-bundle protein [Gemmataceae bacterium]
MATDTTVVTLNSLLRGEISAVETYQQALAKIGNDQGASQLQQMHDEHVEAANALRQHVHLMGGKPDQGSGAWGSFATAVEGVAKLFGNTAALKALKEGEEHGLHSYEAATENDEINEECQMLIRTRLLPQTREHIAVLDQLMAAK